MLFRSPSEFFNIRAMRNIRGLTDYPTDREQQLFRLAPMAVTANGVYGVKLFTTDFEELTHTRWVERFPRLHFVHLVRVDVLGQAISHVRALQTGQWGAGASAQAVPEFDFVALDSEMTCLLHAQNRWRYYFARNNIPVLHLTYEDVCRAPQEAVDKIASLVGLDAPARVNLDEVRVTIQRDAINEEWRERYVARARGLSVFH